MTPEKIRELILMSYKAYDGGNRDFVMDLFDDEIEWTFYQAPETLPFPNRVRGKNNVLKALEIIDGIIESVSNDIEKLVVEGDTAALIIDRTVRQRDSGRVLRYKVAAFQRYRAGRLVEFISFADSVDLLQQSIGQELDLPMAYAK